MTSGASGCNRQRAPVIHTITINHHASALGLHPGTGTGEALGDYLAGRVFAGAALDVAKPDRADVEGYAKWLRQYTAGLAIEKAATEAIS